MSDNKKAEKPEAEKDTEKSDAPKKPPRPVNRGRQFGGAGVEKRG